MRNLSIYLLFFSLLFCTNEVLAQKYALSSNALGLATGDINFEIDKKLDDRLSIALPIYYNPIITNNVSLSHILSQPAVKFWLYHTYTSHYVSVGLNGGIYELHSKQTSYNGWIAGAGVSYGYAWLLTERFNITAECGISFNYLDYDDKAVYTPYTEDRYIYHRQQIVALPYRAAVSIMYLF